MSGESASSSQGATGSPREPPDITITAAAERRRSSAPMASAGSSNTSHQSGPSSFQTSRGDAREILPDLANVTVSAHSPSLGVPDDSPTATNLVIPPTSPSRSPIKRLKNGLRSWAGVRSRGKAYPSDREPAYKSPIRITIESPSSPTPPTVEGFGQVDICDILTTVPADQTIEEFLELRAPSITHDYGTFVTPEHAFLVSAKKIRKLRRSLTGTRKLIPKLGVRIKMIRSEPLLQIKNDLEKCAKCRLTPYEYKCGCKPKYMNGEWCSHMHLMQKLTKGKYVKGLRMYVHEEWKPTEMRHLRAFIQGKDFMAQKDGAQGNVYEANELELRVVRKYVVRVTANWAPATDCACRADRKCPLCEACLCGYSCECPDFSDYRQVCQHVHSVAMLRHKDGEKLFEKFREFDAAYVHTVDSSCDLNRRYYVAEEHDMSYCLEKIVQISEQHKQGCWTPKSQVATIRDSTVWKVYFTKSSNAFVVTSVTPTKCCCPEAEANMTDPNVCSRCNICINHYRCTCVTAKYLICRHVHAVHRHLKGLRDRPEDVLSFLKAIAPSGKSVSDQGSVTDANTPSDMSSEGNPSVWKKETLI